MISSSANVAFPPYLTLYDPQSGISSPRKGGKMALSPSMRLSEFYAAYVLPCFLLPTMAAKRNIEQYAESLKLWRELTGDPPLTEITQEVCALFVAKLGSRKWRGKPILVNTIRKHCTAMQKMIDLAGPRTRRCRIAAKLISGEPVYLERPGKQTRPTRDDFTLAEITAIVAACPTAIQTASLDGFPAAEWWRQLFIFLPNTGLRIGSAMTATWEMFDPNYPGWLDIPPSAYKGGRNGGYFYVNSHALRAIRRIRELSPQPSPLLFPWRDWPESANWLQSCRRKIMAKSGIPSYRHFGFHGCRKFLGTWVAPQNPMLASIILGHKTANVTRDSYVNPKVVEELLERVPQP